VSSSRDWRKCSSSIRWNLSHLQGHVPAASQRHFDRIFVGSVVGVLLAVLGLLLSELQSPIADLLALVAVAILILILGIWMIWAWAGAVVGMLGLFRAGWLLEGDRLVVRGAVSKRFFERDEIRSVHEVICPRNLLWTAIATYESEEPFIARPIPITEIPKIRKRFGLVEAKSSIEIVAPAFRLFLARLRLPLDEAEALVGRPRVKPRLNLTPDTVVLAWAMKQVRDLPNGGDFGEVCPVSSIGIFVDQVEAIEGLTMTYQHFELLSVALGSLRKGSGFVNESLAVAMGEQAPNELSYLGGLVMELLGIQARLGGTDEAAFSERFEEMTAGDPRLRTEVLAWACMAVTRLEDAGKIPRVQELMAPVPVDDRGKISWKNESRAF